MAVLGAGISGLSLARALHFLQAHVTVYSDGSPESWKQYAHFSSFLSPEQLKDARKSPLRNDGQQLLCKSPGVPSSHPLMVLAKKHNLPIWADINLAYHFCKVPIIALTGTNGKTTTTLMIKELLILSGLKVFCGGNIGLPCSNIIFDPEDYDVCVWELSSFQLEYCPHFRADYSCILNITPDHGERYQKFSQYKKAKYNIFKNRRPRDFNLLPEKLLESPSSSMTTYTESDVENFRRRYNWDKFFLQGSFNKENLYVAHTLVAHFLGKEGETQKLIETFKGPLHRLESLGNWCHLQIYNDAKSTNWQSTLEALRSFSDSATIYLILGGKLRGKNDECRPYLQELLFRCKKIFLIGESGPPLHEELGEKSIFLDNLENIKSYLQQRDLSGVLLLSPGFPSFDQFENYKKRGRDLKNYF